MRPLFPERGIGNHIIAGKEGVGWICATMAGLEEKGLTWTKDAANPVFEGGDFSWNSAVVPDDIMKANDGTYVLSYHGYDGSFFRGAVAHSTDLYTWTDPLNNRSTRLYVGAGDAFTIQFCRVGSSMHFIYNTDTGTGIRLGDDMGYETLVANFTGANGSTTFTDESAWGHTLTAAGNAQVQSNKLLLDGSGDYVTSPDSDQWLFGTVDFTIEAFGLEFQTSPTNEPIVSQGTTVGNQLGWLFTFISGQLRFYLSTTSDQVWVRPFE